MAFKPYLTSNDIIESVKRRISFPIAQNTFSEEDILRFANEEIFISQVPSVLEYHDEYFVYDFVVPVKPGVSRYPIPDRAIGMRLRDVFWEDASGNMFEMAKINPDDKTLWQRNSVNNTQIHKYYLEGNDLVLTPIVVNAVGNLHFMIYLRPNQLVKDERAATVQSFVTHIEIDNSNIVANDTVTIKGTVFTAVSGTPTGNEFEIGATSIITATNLAGAINAANIDITATNGVPSTNIVQVDFELLTDSQNVESSNLNGIKLHSDEQCIRFDQVPTTYLNPETNQTEDLFKNGSLIDFLQQKPGHKIRKFDIKIPKNGISSDVICFNISDVPTDLVVGDYICLANEAIIPQLPPDLHNVVVERACARILSAIGDQAGLQSSMVKIQEMEKNQSRLLDQRVDGSPSKISSKNTLLKFGKWRYRGRF